MKSAPHIGLCLESLDNFEFESGLAISSPIALEDWIDMKPVTKASSVMCEATREVVCTACIPSRRDYMNDDINTTVSVCGALLHAGSFALAIFSRTHGAPPSRVNFSRKDGVMRKETVTVSSISETGFLPCPRSFGARLGFSMTI